MLARSDGSVRRAVDLIEYAETAARFEYLNLAGGGRAAGLSLEELRAIIHAFKLTQSYF